ncbi:unnamed protein product [Danaus chrysippus]|uniref:(African queen) hypothetical protein n=1 Tax=Danaus chrysippus TaxID=151541 RepID=A0A8J2QNM3_9NEOP|nr:unnamed protein product [Danaus chrysippus]
MSQVQPRAWERAPLYRDLKKKKQVCKRPALGKEHHNTDTYESDIQNCTKKHRHASLQPRDTTLARELSAPSEEPPTAAGACAPTSALRPPPRSLTNTMRTVTTHVDILL